MRTRRQLFTYGCSAAIDCSAAPGCDGTGLSLTGFGDLELKDLLAERTEGLTDANTSPPSARARARARGGSENQRPWPADKVEPAMFHIRRPYQRQFRRHQDIL